MEPEGYEEATVDHKWINTMKEELIMIEKNKTWELVDRTNHKKAIGVKWVWLIEGLYLVENEKIGWLMLGGGR